jgi:ABC-type transport system involved in multi-copper enzyme maturation permease subunit
MSRKKNKGVKEAHSERVPTEPSSAPPSYPPQAPPMADEGWEAPREKAPSAMHSDEPIVTRVVGLIALSATMLGGVAVLITLFGRQSQLVSPEWGGFFLIIGIVGMLFHAVRDPDVQFRRSYAALGYALLLVAAFVSFLPTRTLTEAASEAGNLFLPLGLPVAVLGLLFLLAFLRHEDNPQWSERTVIVFGLAGVISAGIGLVGGMLNEPFLLPRGLAASLLGLAFLGAYVGAQGGDTDNGRRGGVILGVLGTATFLIALVRSMLPLFFQWHWISTRPSPYLVPSGLLLMGVGILYVLTALLLCAEKPIFVMTRRELMAFFYSPIAYLVLLFFTGVIWTMYLVFVWKLWRSSIGGHSVPEPMITQFLLDWPPVICFIVGIPLLTMRLMSEEWSTGTYEMLMTVPVKESTVVLAKFLAAFLFFLLLWVPFGICLIALRVGGGQPFEYRQLFTFGIAIACMGAGFLSMGLFFSSVTRNQIVAAVITFAGMMLLTCLWLLKGVLLAAGAGQDSAWIRMLTHISYVDVWIQTIVDGVFVPTHVIFHLSFAVFWLFATVKLLEARKWS